MQSIDKYLTGSVAARRSVVRQLLADVEWHDGYAVLGSNVLMRTLGVGGLGVTFLAYDLASGQMRAIKCIRRDRPQSDHVRRLRREARAQSLVDSEPVTGEIQVAGAVHYLPLRFVPGETLFERIKQHGPLPLSLALWVLYQVALDLEFLHAAGRVHRDLSCNNVMVDTDGSATIIDLGLVSGEPDETPITRSGGAGTPGFSAPEQMGQLSAARHPTADIYSLGALLFYMLTATRAEPKLSARSISTRLSERLSAQLSLRLGRVIESCLFEDPKQRFQSARSLRDALPPVGQLQLGADDTETVTDDKAPAQLPDSVTIARIATMTRSSIIYLNASSALLVHEQHPEPLALDSLLEFSSHPRLARSSVQIDAPQKRALFIFPDAFVETSVSGTRKPYDNNECVPVDASLPGATVELFAANTDSPDYIIEVDWLEDITQRLSSPEPTDGQNPGLELTLVSQPDQERFSLIVALDWIALPHDAEDQPEPNDNSTEDRISTTTSPC